MTRRWLAIVFLPAILVGALAAQDSTGTRWARVAYVSGGQIYVSAGRDDGLIEGSELTVVRGDSVIATLRVRYLASTGAACDVTAGTAGDVTPGDQVRFVASAAAAPAPTAAPTPPPPPPRARGRTYRTGLRGRIAARYVLTRTAPDAGQYAQPALDLRAAGARLGGTAFGVAVDVRTRSSRSQFVAGATATRTETNVYQAAVLWQPERAPVRATLGRQYVVGVSSILLLDGLLVELDGRRVGAGVFGGTEPTIWPSTPRSGTMAATSRCTAMPDPSPPGPCGA